MGRKVKKKPATFIFKFIQSKAKQPYHSRINSRNGRICFYGENMKQDHAPIKTVKRLIEAIKKGHYRIDEEYEHAE